jgi:polysaccharide biosynthesis PFTS motif protein
MIGLKAKKVRQMLRGYRRLKQAGALGRPMEAQIALVEKPLGIAPEKISRHLFGAASAKANEAIRDFLIARLGYISLNQSLLISLGQPNGAVVHPLPPAWREVLRSLGWRVAEARCALLWWGFLFLCWGYGVVQLARYLGLGLASWFCRRKQIESPYVFFSGLTRNELPQKALKQSYDILSWYLQWPGREKDLKTICHNVKNIPEFNYQGVKICHFEPLSPLGGWLTNGELFIWGMKNAGLCLLDWLRGRWWSPLMFGPTVQSYVARHQKTYAVDYLFHNSCPKKPLWAYEVEAKSAITTFYFYSTNCDSFKTKKGYQSTPAYYRNMNWSRYLVWNQEQADFVRRCVGNQAKTETVGPVWFGDSAAILPKTAIRTVAVFDIQPRRKSIYEVLGSAMEYYTPAIGIDFLNDIHKAAAQCDWIMAWKGKRKLALNPIRQIAKSYESVCEKLAASPNMLIINPDIAATRLIEKCALVLSMPFTSTALVARNLGKPSYYYDPSGIIQKDDRAAHGIPVISGFAELQKILTMESAKFNAVPQGSCVATIDAACGNC